MIDGAQILVDAPARTPLPYGLLSVVQLPNDSDASHWRGGIRFETDTCEEASIYTDSCAATGAGTKQATTGWGMRLSQPFTVYTMPVCSPVGNFDGYQQRVTNTLLAGEGRAVEREFWTGAHGTMPHLAASVAVTGTGFDGGTIVQTAATVVTGGPLDIVEAISLLEQNLATCYGNEGVIHVPAIAAASLMHKGLVRIDGQRLRSPMGHLVVIGSGYPGTGPDGAAPSLAGSWLYATGAVTLRRTQVEVTSTTAQAVDRAKNDVLLVAERTYVLGWDCCHFAVQARMGGDVAGTAGVPT